MVMNNVQPLDAPGPTPGSIYFPTNSSRITLSPGIVVGGTYQSPFTVEGWFYCGDTPGTDSGPVILSTTTGSATPAYLRALTINVTNSGNQITVDSNGAFATTFNLAQSLIADAWYYVALSRDTGGFMQVWLGKQGDAAAAASTSGRYDCSVAAAQWALDGISDCIGAFVPASRFSADDNISGVRVTNTNLYTTTDATIPMPTETFGYVPGVRFLQSPTDLTDLTGFQTLASVGSAVYSVDGPDIDIQEYVPPEPILYLDAFDYSGSGATWPAETGSDATLINAPAYTAVSPTYFTFNGTDEAATTANLKANFASSNSQTLEIWVRTASDNGVVISQTGTSAIDSFYHLSVMEIVSGDIKMGIWNGSNIGNVTVGAVTRDEWQQYVLTYDDATNTLTGYINAGSPASTTFENDPPVPGWFYHLCAEDGTNMGDGSYLAADVGLFRVYNQAFTAVQVQDLYDENIARFSVAPTTTTFTALGVPNVTTWTAPAGVSRVEYLVVGGGGGGGTGYDSGGGGGGAGGMVLTGFLDVTPATTYAVTVAIGGAGGPDTRTNTSGDSGGNSVFASVTALGGGAGQGSRTFTPTARYTGGAAQVGSSTAALGGGGGGGGDAGGGGGGAGGAGGTRVSASSAGVGGAGVASSITGSSVTYGAGGAGGTANVNNNNGAAGANNTGAGGGAGSALSSDSGGGGNGGSGIVVVKYGT